MRVGVLAHMELGKGYYSKILFITADIIVIVAIRVIVVSRLSP